MAGLSRTCRLCSYNCNSVRKKVDIIRMILKDGDIFSSSGNFIVG